MALKPEGENPTISRSNPSGSPLKDQRTHQTADPSEENQKSFVPRNEGAGSRPEPEMELPMQISASILSHAVTAPPICTPAQPSRSNKILGELLVVASTTQILEYLQWPEVPASELARHSILADIFASLSPKWTAPTFEVVDYLPVPDLARSKPIVNPKVKIYSFDGRKAAKKYEERNVLARRAAQNAEELLAFCSRKVRLERVTDHFEALREWDALRYVAPTVDLLACPPRAAKPVTSEMRALDAYHARRAEGRFRLNGKLATLPKGTKRKTLNDFWCETCADWCEQIHDCAAPAHTKTERECDAAVIVRLSDPSVLTPSFIVKLSDPLAKDPSSRKFSHKALVAGSVKQDPKTLALQPARFIQAKTEAVRNVKHHVRSFTWLPEIPQSAIGYGYPVITPVVRNLNIRTRGSQMTLADPNYHKNLELQRRIADLSKEAEENARKLSELHQTGPTQINNSRLTPEQQATEKKIRASAWKDYLNEKRWCAWFKGDPKPDGDGFAKVPVGKHNDPNTWCTFSEAVICTRGTWITSGTRATALFAMKR